MGGFEIKGLGRIILALLFACVVSWAGVAVLIALSVTSTENLVARLLLLTWVLAIAGWLAVYSGPLRSKVSWWGFAVMAPALPLIGAILGLRSWWKR